MHQALYGIVGAMVLLGTGRVSAHTELLKTRAGSPVHWTHGEITVGLAASEASKTVAQEGVVLAIQRAVQAWNAIHAGQPQLLFVTEQAPQVTVKFCRSQWHGDTIDLGNSQFIASLRDGTIEAATVELNECAHAFTAPNEPQRGRYDLQSVITHELGHVLGLGHSDNPAALMYPNGGGSGVRAPHDEDKASLAILYFGRTRQGSPTLARSGSAGQSPAVPTRGLTTSTTPLLGPEALAAAQLLPMLTLKTSSGRQVIVYTSEPTLLPAMAAAPATQDSRRLSSQRARNNSR